MVIYTPMAIVCNNCGMPIIQTEKKIYIKYMTLEFGVSDVTTELLSDQELAKKRL